MKKIKISFGTGLSTEIVLGNCKTVYDMRYMGEVLRVTTMGSSVDIDLLNLIENMRKKFEIKK